MKFTHENASDRMNNNYPPYEKGSHGPTPLLWIRWVWRSIPSMQYNLMKV